METVIILGLIVILIGGYLRYHRARIYAPLLIGQPRREDPCDDWQAQGLANAGPIGVESRPRLRANLTIALLVFGSLFLVAGWIVGIALLWSSDQWNRRDKIVGTLLL